MLKILLVAGEVSADSHGAALLEELKKSREIRTFGIGGDALAEQEMDLIEHLNKMAFMGVVEVLRHLPFIREVHQKLMDQVEKEKPDLAILIDYPGFNLRLAKSLKEAGIPVIYYISPKLWAWGRRRIKKIKKYIDLMLVLFPFEEKFYQKYKVPVKYTGHPLVDNQQQYLLEKDKIFDPKNVHLGILPGSRRQEVTLLLSKMLETARVLYQSGKIKSAEILKVPNLPIQLYHNLMQEDETFIRIAEKPMYKALPEYDVAIVASGTATLETGYFAVPMLIVYHVNTLTYWLGLMLIKIKHVGLVNIVAEKEVAKEFIQDAFNIPAAVKELERLLEPDTHHTVKQDLKIIRQKLGQPGVSQRAAKAVLDFILKIKRL